MFKGIKNRIFNFFLNKDEKKSTDIQVGDVFKDIYQNNTWQDDESVSGTGSNLKQTQEIINQLPNIFKQHAVHSILDLPCGDYNWMKHVDLSDINYIGGDIVPEIINKNNQQYASSSVSFVELNLITDKLPDVDLVFCRDCLVHLSIAQIMDALQNIKKSNAKYLLTTSFTNTKLNRDIVTGDWRPINLEIVPFNLKPIYTLVEKCTEFDGMYKDKSLILLELK
ncbi:MAG TPA: class I SAM-dependent methyltransferase [Chitinophagales bacterium]|nr:class I SAM-dependent methyltransferase [Chitinophagales bacterium]